MKKVVAILLVLIMACTLFACKTSDSQTEDSADTSSSAPAESTAPETADTAEATEDTATEDAAEDSAETAGTVGYITDDVDHNARDTYQIAYIYLDALTLEKAHFDAMVNMQERLNIEVTDFSAAMKRIRCSRMSKSVGITDMTE